MRKRSKARPFVFCAVIILAVFVAIVILVRAIYSREEERAATLLEEVKALRVGESSAKDIEPIVAKYKGFAVPQMSGLGCEAYESAYVVGIGNYSLNHLGRRHLLPGSLLQPRSVSATFILKNGTLCYVSYRVQIFPRDAFSFRADSIVILASETQFLPFDVRYEQGKSRDLRVGVTTEATAEQHRRAFDLDLSCLARLIGCRTACELHPSAWLDYQKKLRAEGLEPPLENAYDPRCLKLSE